MTIRTIIALALTFLLAPFTRSLAALPAVTRGEYRGLLTGTSDAELVSGVLKMNVQTTGQFTASLNLGGTVYPFAGVFNNSAYSGALGGKIGVSVAFTGSATITGVVSGSGETLTYTGLRVSDSSAAGGRFRFIISPGALLTSGSAPEGIGFGEMHVHGDGKMRMAGFLPDGAPFAAESTMISGSNAAFYLHEGNTLNGGIAGTLVFQDIPSTSDCSGTLYWTQAAKPTSRYPGGFELAMQFTAVAYDNVIGGLEGDEVSIRFTGADLVAPIDTSVKLNHLAYLFHGSNAIAGLNIERERNQFSGRFFDPSTNSWHTFAGVLLPKSRSGAGYFFSKGISGAVVIQY